MTLWQEILTDYGNACYQMSFEELADEYGTTEMAIGSAIAAIKRRGAMCATLEYADGSELKLKMRKSAVRRRKPRSRRRSCGCSGN